MAKIPTINQLKVARTFARAYGHQWGAWCPDATLAEAVEKGNVRVINEFVSRMFWISRDIDPDSEVQKECSPYHGALGMGICGPTVSKGNRGIAIIHCTATGRLRWEIQTTDAGTTPVVLTIFRVINGERLAIMHAVKPEWDIDADITVYRPTYIYERHLRAMLEALDVARRAQYELIHGEG